MRDTHARRGESGKGWKRSFSGEEGALRPACKSTKAVPGWRENRRDREDRRGRKNGKVRGGGKGRIFSLSPSFSLARGGEAARQQ